jgi:hypothetical protein
VPNVGYPLGQTRYDTEVPLKQSINVFANSISMLLNHQRHIVLLLTALVIACIFFYINDGISHSRYVIIQLQPLADTSDPSGNDTVQIHGANGPVQHHDKEVIPIKPEIAHTDARPHTIRG